MPPISHPVSATITRPSIPEQLEQASHALDLLIRDAGLIRSARDYDAAEEQAQAIAASVLVPFRGARSRTAPSAPPLAQETRGARACAWF